MKSDPPIPLPTSIDEIDAGWLTAALAPCVEGLEVESFDFIEVLHGFTTILRTRLRLNSAADEARFPETVVLKGGFEPHSSDAARISVMEAVGYRDVWPQLGLNVPRCYFVGVESRSGRTMIIMEDLTRMGVRFAHPLRPQGFAQVERRLSSLAVLHAQTWDRPEVKAGGRWEGAVLAHGPDLFAERLMQRRIFNTSVWEGLVESPRGWAASEQFHDPVWARQALECLSAISHSRPPCIVHGDTHLGNLYEEPDGTPGFFDAIPRREPACIEVTYHLTCALDPSDRRRWDRELIAHYLDQLSQQGVTAPELDQMMHDYALSLPYGYLTFLANRSQFQSEAVNTAYVARFSAAMLDHGSKGLI